MTSFSERNEKLSIAQVGAGFWGASWARLVMASPWATLTGLVDHDAERLARVADQLSLPEECRFASFEDAALKGGARAALIAVPPAAHREAALEALNAGLHCLVEKPFAPSLAEAHEVTAVADRLGRRVMVGQNYRFRRGPETVRRLISQGAIGRVESVHGRLVKELRLNLTGWRSHMGEPIIVDQAVHHFDFLRSIFGVEPTQVRAFSFNPSWSWFEGNACAAVEFRSDDCYVSYFGNWVSRGGVTVDTSFEGDWEVQGERGCISWRHGRVTMTPTDLDDLIFYPGAYEREGGVLEIPLVALDNEERTAVLREFADAIRVEREPKSSGRDNIQTLALVLAAEAAVPGGGWVDIRDFMKRN